jgi:hypothetical protein
VIIYLGAALLLPSCSLPECTTQRKREKHSPLRHHTSRVIPSATPRHRDGFTFIFGFAPRGVCRAALCYHERGELLPHRFTLTAVVLQKRIAAVVQIKLVGGLFSVALSIGSERRKNIPFVAICRPVVNRRGCSLEFGLSSARRFFAPQRNHLHFHTIDDHRYCVAACVAVCASITISSGNKMRPQLSQVNITLNVRISTIRCGGTELEQPEHEPRRTDTATSV